MSNCTWNCLRSIPWWAWLILGVAAVLIAIITFLTGGVALLSLPVWIEAALVGLGSTFGATLALCLGSCFRPSAPGSASGAGGGAGGSGRPPRKPA